MDDLLLNLYLKLPLPAQIAVLVIFPLIVAAKAYCASTPTPPPNTLAGKIYRLIELGALLVGKAKQEGVPVPTLPTLEAAARAEFDTAQKEGRPFSWDNVAKALNGAVPLLAACIIAIALAGCSTQQTQTALTVACTADKLAPTIVTAGTTIALITDPAAVGAVEAARAADAAAHPVVQAACDAALAGSVPVAGTVNAVSVPVAPPVSQTTAVILPVAAPSK